MTTGEEALEHYEASRVARAHIDAKYGPFPDDENWVSIEHIRRDEDGWHVRAYIKMFGFVHVLVENEMMDILRPLQASDDYLAEE